MIPKPKLDEDEEYYNDPFDIGEIESEYDQIEQEELIWEDEIRKILDNKVNPENYNEYGGQQ